MTPNSSFKFAAPSLSRRRLLQGAGALAAYAALDSLLPSYARAQGMNGMNHGGHGAATSLAPAGEVSASGTDVFDLTIGETRFGVNGRIGVAQTVNGTVPGPILRLREGNEAIIRVRNDLAETSSIHWHGLIVPMEMDGVPGVSFAGIEAGTTFEYRFPVLQSGTYWYHSHSGGQELRGVYGPLIIDPIAPEPFAYDRDYIVMLSDWSFMMPETIMKRMKQMPGYFNFQKRTVGEFLSDTRKYGWKNTVDNYRMWSRMRMDPTDFADVTGIAYTFLMNGMTSAANWTGLFTPGEKVRLRFINAATMTIHDVRIPGLKMTVVQVDGQNVAPVEIDEFRFAPAETYDVIVEPKDDRAYAIFSETMGRDGFAMGTLAPRAGMRAPMPERRSRPLRTMADMGMDMNMEGMDGMPGMNMGGMGNTKNQSMDSMPGMDMGGMKMGGGANQGHAAMGDMSGMKMSGPQRTSGMVSENASRDMNMNAMPTPGQHQMAGMSMAGGDHPANMNAIPGATPVPHERDTHGPGNQAVPMVTRSRLNEPGTGLENNGRRVLVYTDLRAISPYPDQRPAEREVELHLTGNMEQQIWGFDGKKYSEAPAPIQFKYGERVRMTLVNDTMMEHPIHLHGMWFHLENGHGELLPRRHTVLVKPAERISLLITADAPGRWAMHCHLLFHMEMGMFRVVEVVGAPPGAKPGDMQQKGEMGKAPASSTAPTNQGATGNAMPGMDMGDMKMDGMDSMPGMKMGGNR